MISVGSSTPTTQKLPRAPFVVARICCVAPAHAAIKASLLSAGTCQRYITWIIELALQILAPGWFPAAGRIHFLHENSWRRTHFLQRGPCPLWVTSRHVQRKTACLLYPRKRTCAVQLGMSLWAKSGNPAHSKRPPTAPQAGAVNSTCP